MRIVKSFTFVMKVITPFLLVVSAAYPQTKQKAEVVSAEETAVRQTEADLADAYLKGDVAQLDNIWADEFTFTAPNGLVISKGQYVAMLRSGQVTYESLTPKRMEVQLYGDTAVVRAQVAVRGKVGDHILDGIDSYMTIYVKRSGRWQQVATLATRMPPAASKSS